MNTDALKSNVVQHCESMIQVGSKSFSLASRFFETRERWGAFSIYAWCRTCDDEIDLNEQKFEKLKELRKKTQAVFDGDAQVDPTFQAFQLAVREFEIPSIYPIELLEGMEMDVQNRRYETLEDLKLYCYRVASTVGLMMVHVMRVSDPRALPHANDMGMAMQLTNIARDIFEDVALGRVYLPLAWLREEGIPLDQLQALPYRQQLVKVVDRLLQAADLLYASGRKGLRYLPLRSAIAVSVASQLYREIGQQVRRRGAAAWDTRTVVPIWRKIGCVLRGLANVLKGHS